MKNIIVLALTLAFSLACSQNGREVQTTGSDLIGGDFKMKTQHGKTVTRENFKGKHMLVFFGFTSCPTVCPLGLHAMSNALRKLPASIQDEIQPIFVTVDPERDTGEVLEKYVSLFNKDIVALRGTKDEVDSMIRNYRGYYAKIEDDDDYSYEHSDIIYFMDENGRYVYHFSSASGAEAIAERIREYME